MGKQHTQDASIKNNNVGNTERILSALAGGILLASGLSGRKRPIQIVSGGFLL